MSDKIINVKVDEKLWRDFSAVAAKNGWQKKGAIDRALRLLISRTDLARTLFD
jgi:antitoxin component of RelBE/YafQ-DinJ toxin-antitoxin module